MKLFQFSSLVVALTFSFTLVAQSPTQYVIKLDILAENTSDLEMLSDIGNVYFESSSTNQATNIVVGTFSDLQKAEAIAKTMHDNNFPNAYVAPLPVVKGIDVFVIQLADFRSNDQIDWERYQLNKKVYTTIEPGRFKIVTGIFPDYDSALPLHNELFQIGFTNAEVVKVNSVYLHEVNQSDIAFQQKLHHRNLGKVSEFTAKGGTPSTVVPAPVKKNTKEVAPPIVGRVALSKSIAPAINESMARISVKNLQSILSVYGNYNTEPNGLYDDKTANAYYATVQLTPSLKEFSALVESKSKVTSGYFTDWSDIRLLLSISENITGRDINFSDAELKALVSLFTKPKALSLADAQKVKDWHIGTTGQLQNWKSNGKLSSQTLQAYMLVSTKVEVLLEDYYLNKGFAISQASDLAKATMFAMLLGNYTTI